MINDVVILAAGKGTRMRSKMAKVLQPLASRPLLQHVVDSASLLENKRLHIVIGHDADNVKKTIQADQVFWPEQLEQLGTGHAVAQAAANLSDDGVTLVLYGDVPLISTQTMQQLIALVDANSMAVLTVVLDNPTGYGRIIRNNSGQVQAIVEEKDASEEQRKVNECNSGIIAINTQLLKHYLPQISNQNAQQEYYLTDLIALLAKDGKQVHALIAEDEAEVQGVNDKKQLAQLERLYQQKQADNLLVQGVTLLDPARLDIRGKLSCGQDVTIDVNCIFQGEVELGDNVSIGANCIIGELGSKTAIGSGTTILANSIIEQADIAENCTIGPFARIRPATEMANGAKIGNFVEVKKSTIGEGSKVNHLTYIGDAEIGKNVNVGAGTITCNYDGANKFKTVLEDNVFIGSNSSLVAPLTIAEGATVGAGSTVTQNVKTNELAVARGKQRNIANWPRPKKQ